MTRSVGSITQEGERVLAEATGAKRVFVFDRTVRRRAQARVDRVPGTPRQPVPRIHAIDGVVKCYGSATNGRARFVAHAAFEDPTVGTDVPPRESIEPRTFVLH